MNFDFPGSVFHVLEQALGKAVFQRSDARI